MICLGATPSPRRERGQATDRTNLTNSIRSLLLRGINWQQHAIAKGRFKPLDRTVLVAAAGSSADTDRSDHFTVNNNGNAAGVGKEPELHQLSRLPARIVLQLSCADRSGLARLQCSLGLEHRGVDIGVDLTV